MYTVDEVAWHVVQRFHLWTRLDSEEGLSLCCGLAMLLTADRNSC